MINKKHDLKNNVLVTGSNGQVGTELRDIVKRISPSEDNDNYIFTARESNGDDIVALDVTDELAVKSFIKENNINVIVNCAAYTKVDLAETEYEAAKSVNEDAPRYLAEAAKQNDAVLIHLSTDYVFDGRSSVPYKENDIKHPLNVYGKTKSNGEDNVINSGCRYIIIRTQWLYSNHGKNFFKTIFGKLWKNVYNSEKDILNVVNDQIGTPTSAHEVAYAIFYIISRDDGEKTLSRTGVYHFRNDGIASWYDFAWEIYRLIDKRMVSYSPGRCLLNPVSTSDYDNEFGNKGKTVTKRPLYGILNIDKFTHTFGLFPFYWKRELESVFEKEIHKMNN